MKKVKGVLFTIGLSAFLCAAPAIMGSHTGMTGELNVVYAQSVDTAVYQGVDYSAVYDFDYYYNQNADVANAFGYDPDALIAHFVNFGMAEGRCASPNFNVVYYRYDLNNQDLRYSLGADMTAYYMHYINFGQYENRSVDSWSDVFDPQKYLDANPDVKANIVGRFTSDGNQLGWALWHFVEYGANEGRSGCSDFDVQVYKAENQDLVNVYGNAAYFPYYQHYIFWGKNEGRISNYANNIYHGVDYSAVYDKEYYLYEYPDIAAAFGGDTTLTLEHFINFGMAEGREGNSEFRVNIYRDNYEDLQEKYKDDLKAYYMDYLNTGKAEGRSGNEIIPKPCISNTEANATVNESVNLAIYSFTGEVTWKISDPSVASITTDGSTCIVTGIKPGSVGVTATLNGKKEFTCNIRFDAISQETPWVYDSATKRHKTMFDGTVVQEQYYETEAGGTWGYFDDEVARAMFVEIQKMQKQVYGDEGVSVWNESDYQYAKARTVYYAAAGNGSTGGLYHMNSGGLPNVSDNRRYITFFNGYKGGLSIACYVRDSVHDEFTYGSAWRAYFGTYYSSST